MLQNSLFILSGKLKKLLQWSWLRWPRHNWCHLCCYCCRCCCCWWYCYLYYYYYYHYLTLRKRKLKNKSVNGCNGASFGNRIVFEGGGITSLKSHELLLEQEYFSRDAPCNNMLMPLPIIVIVIIYFCCCCLFVCLLLLLLLLLMLLWLMLLFLFFLLLLLQSPFVHFRQL